MINRKKIAHNKGFTLIEVLVAIFVLITAVVVPLTIGSKAFAYSNFVRDQSVASYLAQEAVEFVRLQRDNASLNPSPNGGWDDFKFVIGNCMVPIDNTIVNGCYFDVRNQSPTIASCGAKCPSMYLQTDGQYTYVSGTNKAFIRSVQTQVEGSGIFERVRVDVTVSWNTNGISGRSFTVTDYFTPWQI